MEATQARGMLHYLSDHKDMRDASLLWSGLGRSGRKVIIVAGHIDNSEDAAIGAGEGRAAAYIPLVLRHTLGNVHIEVTSPSELLHDYRHTLTELGNHDLVLLGGPVSNELTRLAIERLSTVDGDSWIADSCSSDATGHWVRHRETMQKRRSTYKSGAPSTPTNMTEDWGIFVIRPNCFSVAKNPRSRVVLCYGAHTYGTEAAANTLFSFSSAAAITRAYRNRDVSWCSRVDGEVHVCSEEHQDVLLRTNRRISVVNPPSLREVTLDNPVLAGLPFKISHFQRAYYFEQLINFFGFFFCFVVLAVGSQIGSLPLIVVSLIIALTMIGLAVTMIGVKGGKAVCDQVFPRLPASVVFALSVSAPLTLLLVSLSPWILDRASPANDWLTASFGNIAIICIFAGVGSLLAGQAVRAVYYRRYAVSPHTQPLVVDAAPANRQFDRASSFCQGISSVLQIMPKESRPDVAHSTVHSRHASRVRSAINAAMMQLAEERKGIPHER